MNYSENKNNVAASVISDFYAKKSVFITGGTGYLGKVLIEKLLRSCAKLDKIYILIREKKDISIQKRKESLLENVLFTRLKEEYPDSLKKVIAITGDLSKPDLGISENDRRLLIENVSVVIHMAATLRFDEPLETALKMNVGGTLEILKLCRQMEKIDALVHVSTAYSNTDKKFVEERVYTPPIPLDQVYAFVKENGGNDAKEAEFINGRPNTYTYTKAIAEHQVLINHGDIPTAIVRPSVVTPTMREPIPGWLDNWNGMTATLLGLVKGMIHVVPGCSNCVLDLIPIDIVINMIIVAATRCQKSKDLKVYNCCSGPRSSLTCGQISSYATQLARNHKLNELLYPGAILTPWPILVLLIRFFSETLPVYLIDFWLRISGGSPKYLKLLKKFQKVMDLQTYFRTHEWEFQDDNVRDLIRTMSPEDRAVFYCDPEEIQWKAHITDYIFGIFKYLLKNP